jgi:hypothetical protein
MSKKNKNFVVEGPEVYNMDDLGYMTDESLYERANRLESEKNRMMSSGRDPYLWEVELAYVRREQVLRRTRADLHAEYVQKFAHTRVDDNMMTETPVSNDPTNLN